MIRVRELLYGIPKSQGPVKSCEVVCEAWVALVSGTVLLRATVHGKSRE
jgi:hypothetical protein